MNAAPGPERKRLRQVPPGRQPMLHRIFRADPLTVREAVVAGAAGFSTGRTDNHRSRDGSDTPASEASAEELVGIAGAFEGLSHGVLQAVSDFDMERGHKHFKTNQF